MKGDRKALIVVQARMRSSRLPGKIMLEAAGKPFLGHLLDRLRAVKKAAGIVVATTTNDADDAIVRYCAALGVASFRGSEADVLGRIHGACAGTSPDAVVRITADCPAIDPKLIDLVIEAYYSLPGAAYAANTLGRRLPRGMDVEVISMTALAAADREATTASDREHVTPFIRRHPDRFPAINVASPFFDDLSSFRFTLDYPQDFEQLSRLFELLSDAPLFGLQRLMDVAREHDLLLRDAHFPRSDWVEGPLDSLGGTARAGLGAAQFGSRYGTFNRSGQPSTDEVEAILRHAREAGFSVIDTASTYGESERVLGGLAGLSHGFRLVTKTRTFDGEISAHDAEATVVADARESLTRLRCDHIHALLVHGPDDLLRPAGTGIYGGLRRIKEEGAVTKIGVSVYSPAQLTAILERYELDLVQLPFNVLSRDFLSSGLLAELARRGIEVHARSVFLQGLLLAEPATLPPFFEKLRPSLTRFAAAAAARGMTPAAAALAFVLAHSEVSVALVGFDSLAQLQQLLVELPQCHGFDVREFMDIEAADKKLVNPVNWR